MRDTDDCIDAKARQAKVALLERLRGIGERNGRPKAFQAAASIFVDLHKTNFFIDGWPYQEASIFAELDKAGFFIDGWPYQEASSLATLDRAGFFSEPGKAGPSKPSARPKHSHIAARQRLSELLKLDRYERRAIGRRQRSLRALAKGEHI
jgi:hypothetical protein